jgi:hemoglobin
MQIEDYAKMTVMGDGNNTAKKFGVEDASYIAAGGQSGIEALVEDFYLNMDRLNEASEIRALYPSDLTQAKTKLSYFICGWLGGPKLYSQNFGSINIPSFHSKMQVDNPRSEAWLLCMEKAIRMQDYDPAFCDYLVAAFRVPATRIVDVCKSTN